MPSDLGHILSAPDCIAVIILTQRRCLKHDNSRPNISYKQTIMGGKEKEG
jgi:hypothetical protein